MTTIFKSDIVEDFHGVKVADPYRWLEDPTSEETMRFSQEQMNKTIEYFAKGPNKEEDRQRLSEILDYPKYFVPKKVKESLYYLKNEGLANQASLYKKEGETETIVLDPNTFSDDGTIALANYSFSYDGKYLAYSVTKHGSDWQNIFVKDLQTNKDLEDKIEWVKFTNIAWAPDDSGFYYSRFPQPGTVAPEDESKFMKVYFHKLGTSQNDDELIFEHENKDLMCYPFISDDKQYLCLSVYNGTAVENDFYVKPLKENSPFIYLFNKMDASYDYVTNDGEKFYFRTDLAANNGRVVFVDLLDEEKTLIEVIPEQPDLMDWIKFVQGKFIISLLHNAHHQLHIYDQEGNYQKRIEIPVIGSLTNISGSNDDEEIYFGITSYLTPTTIFKYKVGNDELEVFAEAKVNCDTSQFETKQIFYTSKDGTKVPMFITARKDIELNGENRVLLYGYGGFNINLTPTFNPSIIRWLEKGGVYAVANLRGGMEFGESWHRAGMLENKQNVFDDFIAAGEWLIQNGYTKEKKLAIMGGSNGGLLVAACMVQRPDLFGGVLCLVPVIDMLRYHKFTVGRFWVSEYGDPQNPDHFKFLYAYSPLHNVQEGVKYPPILIGTAESDDRVVPAHALKFTATLNEKAHKNSKVILRIESKAGHGHGKPTSKIINEWVDYFAFLDQELVL